MDDLTTFVGICGFVGFCTFVTPVLLHQLMKKYVTHLVYKDKTGTYTAYTINFFGKLSPTEFKASDVKIPDVPAMFTSVVVNGKELYFDPGAFSDMHHYKKLMGEVHPMGQQFKKREDTAK